MLCAPYLHFEFASTHHPLNVVLYDGNDDFVEWWLGTTSGSGTYSVNSENEGSWSFNAQQSDRENLVTVVKVSVSFTGVPLIVNQNQAWIMPVEDQVY